MSDQDRRAELEADVAAANLEAASNPPPAGGSRLGAEDVPEAPTTFQIVYAAADRSIVGTGPFDAGTDFGPDYPIAELPIDQQARLLSLDNAYLCADGQTVGPEPC